MSLLPSQGCSKKFKTVGGLQYHIIHHNQERVFGCPHCKKILKSEKRLENHVRSKHPDGKQVEVMVLLLLVTHQQNANKSSKFVLQIMHEVNGLYSPELKRARFPVKKQNETKQNKNIVLQVVLYSFFLSPSLPLSLPPPPRILLTETSNQTAVQKMKMSSWRSNGMRGRRRKG